MPRYASGQHAFGFCDVCGFRYPLGELKSEVENYSKVNILACPECWKSDQPQNHLGTIRMDDPQALRNPRPPIGIAASRSLTGFDPVRGVEGVTYLGEAYAIIS